MELKQLISLRREGRGVDFDVVYEWEDVIVDNLRLSFYYDFPELRWKSFLCRHFPLYARTKVTSDNALMFVMQPLLLPNGTNKKNIIPCIIDFYEKDKDKLEEFYRKYDKNPLVLISSREVYDYLKEMSCPLNIIHWGLSISDHLFMDVEAEYMKKYDVIMIGRQNSMFCQWLIKYAEAHSITYLLRRNGEQGMGYYDNYGRFISSAINRTDYLSLIRSAKVGLYSTPGMDGGDLRTNGFNQVTPRFLEYLVSQCHVIARYISNSDTNYYELEKYWPAVESYEAFEFQLDFCMNNKIDKNFYYAYLRKHSTSRRVKELVELLEKI